MKPLLIIKTGEKIPSLAAIPGDYEQWIVAGMGLEPAQSITVNRGEVLPLHESVSAVVITGSGSMVTERAPWMEATAAWLREAVARQLPLLGICFGHQLLAYALGGRVDYNPAGVEVGTVAITLTAAAAEDPLFSGLPARFSAQVSHRQSVVALPPGAKLLATSDMEPHQAFAIGPCAWGVQFHPEFDERIIPHYIDSYREQLQSEGRETGMLLQQVGATPQSASLLPRFAAIIRAGMA